MKNKYKTGDYTIILFDQHGTKQKTIYAQSCTQAMNKGEKKTKKPPYASYVVSRVIKNSLDNAYPWSAKQ